MPCIARPVTAPVVPSLLLSTVLTVSVGLSGQAHASDLTAAHADQNFSFSVGGGVAVRPTYEGSDDYEVVGFPLIAPRFFNNDRDADGTPSRSRVDFRGLDDVRFRLIDWHGFEAGPLAGYNFGRDENDGALLTGLGDIDAGVVVGGFAGYRFDRVLLDVAYLENVTSDSDTGFELRLAAHTELDLTDSTGLTLGLGTTYADANYMRTYFGISANQSAASGFSAYTAEAGFKDVYLDAKLKTTLTETITLSAGGRYQRLIGDAADSPIVASEDQFSGSVGLSYRFDLGSR